MTPEPSAMSYDHGEKTEEELGREGADSTSPTPKPARSTRKPSSKKTKKASKPAARKTSARSSSKKPKVKTTSTRKPSKRPAATAKKPPPKKPANGTERTSKDGTKFWVMSVHIPVSLLTKLDRKVAALVKAGKRSSRSQFAIESIRSKL